MHVSPFLLIGAMAFAGCATAPRPAVERFRAAEATFAGEVDEPTGEGGLRRHILNGFAGLAREDADLAGVALGIDYEYRLSELWGFGGFTEAVVGEGRALIAGVDVVLHPAEAVSLFVGYGQEQKSDEWEGIVRVGGLYEFPIGEGVDTVADGDLRLFSEAAGGGRPEPRPEPGIRLVRRGGGQRQRHPTATCTWSIQRCPASLSRTPEASGGWSRRGPPRRSAL